MNLADNIINLAMICRDFGVPGIVTSEVPSLPSLPSKLKYFLILAGNCSKIEVENFPYCAISHENQSLSHIFCPWLSRKTVFWLLTCASPLQTYFFGQFRYKIREILIKNQKEKSRETFRDIHWIGHHTKIPPDSWCEPST